MKRVIVVVGATLFVLAAGAATGIWSGAYDIGTGNHDGALLNRALAVAMRRSVHVHARSISSPPLTDPAEIRMGFRHYDEMCVSCHGAPGIDPDEIGEGLWPKAPALAKTVPTWTPAELFWITKHGVKFTAMPAWGPSHNDKMIWAMVAFMERLPTLSAADYRKYRKEAGSEGSVEHE